MKMFISFYEHYKMDDSALLRRVNGIFTSPSPTFNIRDDFPILHEIINGHQLVYLDNAATTQKPSLVISASSEYYQHYNSNIHRSSHTLARRATKIFEDTRKKTAEFIGSQTEEIIFTHGTTESINLVAKTFGEQLIQEGDIIAVSQMEHHSNIVPWQQLARLMGATIMVIPFNSDGYIDMDELTTILRKSPKIVAITHMSNIFGLLNPIKRIVQLCHENGAYVVVDGAQSIAHTHIDVKDMDCDFFAFSAHKIYGPTGIGILYGKHELLEQMEPWQTGGSMIEKVDLQNTNYRVSPMKFEAGTPSLEQIYSFGKTIDYLESIGSDRICAYEEQLTQYAMEQLSTIPNIKFLGTSEHRIGVITFYILNVKQCDIGEYLDKNGIAVRVGHMCAQPLLEKYGRDKVIRISLGIYNNHEEIDKAVRAIKECLN